MNGVPSSLFRTSRAPMGRPRQIKGTHRMDCVVKPVARSGAAYHRGSTCTSLTTCPSPVRTAAPAIPSLGGSLFPSNESETGPKTTLKTKSFVSLSTKRREPA